MPYTVKQLADLAGVTRRTLHYYDEIGLLPPSETGENGYRHYDDDAIMTLQQILFYRELGLGLKEIRDLLERPDYDVLRSLKSHRQALNAQAARLGGLIRTVEQTIRYLQGDIQMNPRDLFTAFDEETQRHYEEEAMQRWDPQVVKKSNDLWRSYSKEKQKAILQEAGEIYTEIMNRMPEGPESPNVQAAVGRWHQNMRYFYEPTAEVLRGLGQAYEMDPAFAATFASMHPDLPAFLNKAIEAYCRKL